SPRGRGSRGSGGGAGAGPGGGNADADLKTLWALGSLGVDAFIPWKPVASLPDLPGEKVEVGGFRPYVKSVPPAAMLDSLAARHDAFLLDIAQRLPRLALRAPRVERLGPGVARVSID